MKIVKFNSQITNVEKLFLKIVLEILFTFLLLCSHKNGLKTEYFNIQHAKDVIISINVLLPEQMIQVCAECDIESLVGFEIFAFLFASKTKQWTIRMGMAMEKLF